MQTLTWLHIHIMKINSLNPKVSEVKMVKETVEKKVSPLSSSKFIMLAKVLIHFAFKCRIMFFSTVKLVQGFWNASFDICHSNVFVMCSKTFHNLNSKERIIFIWTIKKLQLWGLQSLFEICNEEVACIYMKKSINLRGPQLGWLNCYSSRSFWETKFW